MLVGCVLAAAAWADVLMLVKEYDAVRNPRIYRLLGFPLAGAAIVAQIGLSKLVLGRSLAEIGQGWDELAGRQRGLVGLLVVATRAQGAAVRRSHAPRSVKVPRNTGAVPCSPSMDRVEATS